MRLPSTRTGSEGCAVRVSLINQYSYLPSRRLEADTPHTDLTQASPTDLDFSVLLAPHEGVPPLYIQVCGLDPLRDEGFLYEKLLRERGIKTNVDSCAGVPHNFQLSMPDIGAGVKFDKDFREGVRWLLANSK